MRIPAFWVHLEHQSTHRTAAHANCISLRAVHPSEGVVGRAVHMAQPTRRQRGCESQLTERAALHPLANSASRKPLPLPKSRSKVQNWRLMPHAACSSRVNEG